MTYTTSLLRNYPSLYEPSSLISDDYVPRSSFGTFYEPSVSYLNRTRLFDNDLTYTPLDFGSRSYRSTVYSHVPLTSYRGPSIPDWHRDTIRHTSYTSLNDVREYSESLGTVSDATTISSINQSRTNSNQNRSTNSISSYHPNFNRALNDFKSPPSTNPSIVSQTKVSTNKEKPTSTDQSIPTTSTTIVQKQVASQLSKENDSVLTETPLHVQISSKKENNIHPSVTSNENEENSESADVQTPSNDTSVDGKTAEQAWTAKIEQLHAVKAQREKEKTKLARSLPALPKPNDDKPSSNKSKSTAHDHGEREISIQMQTGAYFDSLFDGNFVRKTSTNQPNHGSFYHRSIISRNQTTGALSNKYDATITPKYLLPRKASQYEPPSTNNRYPGKRNIFQKSQETVTPRENIHKDADERFQEALQRFRTDRAEQQQKESTESTAKRIDYGNYVRRSTKEGSLPKTIKPSPWTAFLDMKKGNAYSLAKEEKRDLVNQSRSYGEKIRNRNFAIHQTLDTTRTERRIIPMPISNEDMQSGDELPQDEDDYNDQLKSSNQRHRITSVKTTNRTYTKETPRNRKVDDSAVSSPIGPSEEDENVSDFEMGRQEKKKSYGSKYDSSVRTISATEESGYENEEKPVQENENDIFTVREEKTLESLENGKPRRK